MPPRQAVPLGSVGNQWSLLSGMPELPALFSFCFVSRSKRSSSHCQALTLSPICGKSAWFVWLKKRARSSLGKHQHLSWRSSIQSKCSKSAYSPLSWGCRPFVAPPMLLSLRRAPHTPFPPGAVGLRGILPFLRALRKAALHHSLGLTEVTSGQ